MIELNKHIEHLLLENDCVVVPGLGGFIAHCQPAHYEEAEGVFLPPIRTVGFNPQLTMNDGMLVQSYMQAYHTDFPDATRKIEETVERMKEQLYSEGVLEMHGIGTLHYNIYGTYEFEPTESGLLTPSLYGLDSFTLSLLGEKVVAPEVEAKVIEMPQVPAAGPKEYRLNPQQWLGNAVAVAVAVILFFVLSAPVENTYIDKGNYASLGTDCLFDAIRSHSMATALNVSDAAEAPQRVKTKEARPVVVKVEKVAPAPKKEKPAVVETPAAPVKREVKEVKETKTVTPAAETKKTPVAASAKPGKKSYHIIVASLATSADARQSLQAFKQKGYTGALVIEGNGRFRISLCSYADKTVAYQKLNELKQDDAFKSAWLLTSK
ncbi:MAG: SPOR domain-containing protein [Bacteroides sp.]|nr:SPOR domain-containing protein [Bacteroides sp.]